MVGPLLELISFYVFQHTYSYLLQGSGWQQLVITHIQTWQCHFEEPQQPDDFEAAAGVVARDVGYRVLVSAVYESYL